MSPNLVCRFEVFCNSDINLDGEKGIKTLGVSWNPQTDVLGFAVSDVKVERLTKRTVLSRISRLFDPLGLASVTTIKARIALQEIWKTRKYDWDDALPEEMSSLWNKLFRDIESLDSVEIPRCLQPENVSGASELHVFADASSVAYGAVAYLLWPTNEGPHVSLIASKARVAPLRQTTIPRLELMAALIASRLANTIYNEFKIKPEVLIMWSDSKIVLHWLRSDSASLKAFVGVRVAEIQSTWDSNCWKFVPTKLNPADDLSRGLSVEDMRGRWMNGPAFLRKPKDEWPQELPSIVQDDQERKKAKFIGIVSPADTPPIEPSAYSSWQRLTRITAYCQRFIHNAKASVKNPSERKCGPLQPDEMKNAERFLDSESSTKSSRLEKSPRRSGTILPR